MKKSTLAIVIASVVVGVLALAGVIVGVGYMAMKGVKSTPTTDDEKKLVLSAASFAPFDQQLDPNCDTFKTTRTFQLSTEIEHEHACESASIYVRSTAQVSLTANDARQNWLVMIGGYRAGMAVSGANLTVERRENLLTFGDQRYAGIIKMGEKNVGNVFVVRQGRVVHSVVLTGIYFDEAGAVRDLLEPVVEASKRQYGGAAK